MFSSVCPLFQTCLQILYEYTLTYRNIATYFFQMMHRWSTACKRMRKTLTYIHHTNCCSTRALQLNRPRRLFCQNLDDVNFPCRVCLSSETLIQSQESFEPNFPFKSLSYETTIVFDFDQKKTEILFAYLVGIKRI